MSRLRPVPIVWRTVIIAPLVATFLLQAWRQWRWIQEGVNGFLIGDWLISYAGGPVRRGLFGTLLTAAFPSPPAALTALWVTQTLLYALVFGVVIRWAIVLPDPRRWVLLLLSPAFLMFGLGDFGGTHRKEILVLAGLLLVAETVRIGRGVTSAAALTLPLFVVGVLSHELNALLVVPFLLLLGDAARSGAIARRAQRLLSAGFALTAAGGFAFSVLATGTVAQRDLICADLLARGFDPMLCSGSLSYMGKSAADALALTSASLPRSLLYLIPAVLATVPLALTPWARRHQRRLLLAVAPLLLLFPIAIDWGRWLMLMATVATVLTVVGASRAGEVPRTIPVPVLVVFLTTWRIPHFFLSPETALPGGIVRAAHLLLRLLIDPGSVDIP